MIDNAHLKCSQCLTVNGNPAESTIPISDCSVIGNKGGKLVCEVPSKNSAPDLATTLPFPLAPKAEEEDTVDNPGSPLDHTEATAGLPPGPYSQTCTECYLGKSGTVLACRSCARDDGTTRFSIVETRYCSEFDNKDGTLFCSKPVNYN